MPNAEMLHDHLQACSQRGFFFFLFYPHQSLPCNAAADTATHHILRLALPRQSSTLTARPDLILGRVSKQLRDSLPAQTRAYKVRSWEDATDFLTQVAKAAGKLVKGGEPDLNTMARMVLLDWQRGRLPYFCLPALDAGPAQVGSG